ncbi:transcription elongation factor GreA [Candidatus Parcubacteria bacterium]|nr:MAG: transcription elongation factor GreA [Candidatus Parcubacteria bacterium]
MQENAEYISADKLKELKNELEILKSSKRQEISQRIEEAKKLGDLSENAEYMEAREAQDQNERRIYELEDLVKRAVVIQKSKPTGKVQIGSTIKVKSGSETKTYHIVGSEDADPLQGKISNESPIGKALLGKKVGDVVEIKTPSGVIKYTIGNIS